MGRKKHKARSLNEDGGRILSSRNATECVGSGYAREAVLLICLSLLAGMFIITGFVSRTYHKRIHTLADRWFAQGDIAYKSGNYATAIIDFHNALVYSPANTQFQFHLAQALASTGNYTQAQSYLLNLLTLSPGSGEINLALARIAARSNSMTDAMRYYNGAIYGVWSNNPLQMRWDARFELCKYLLDQNAEAQAQPELIALVQETPPGDIDREKKAGSLLLAAGLPDQALQEFHAALGVNRHDAEALAGAGNAEFESGKYSEAIDYLERLPSKIRETPEIEEALGTAREVQAADPFLSHLSNQDKAKRTTEALAQAEVRLTDCAHQRGEALSAAPTATTLQTLSGNYKKMKSDWSERSLEQHTDRIEVAMSLVFEIENAAAQECGAPQSSADNALLLIGRGHGGAGR